MQKKGKIEISVEEKTETVTIHVKDNGSGVTKDLQSHLFTKFTRGEKAWRMKTKGVSLGLFIIKSLVEMQSGKVWYKSNAGKGSIFSFSLLEAGS